MSDKTSPEPPSDHRQRILDAMQRHAAKAAAKLAADRARKAPRSFYKRAPR